jgi:hypothetical protein
MQSHSFTQRLSTLYPNYFAGWRALFGVPATIAAPTPIREPAKKEPRLV